MTGDFGSPLEGHTWPFGLSFTLGISPSVWGPLVSPQGYDDEWKVICGRCQASRPFLGWPVRHDRVGDLPRGITFSSKLQIGWFKCPLWSSRRDIQHGNVRYVIWVKFVPCLSVICADTSEWTFICMTSTSTSSKNGICAPYYLYSLQNMLGHKTRWTH